jgi:hypothetical protein
MVREDGEDKPYADVFVVDVPDDVAVPGPDGPLQGTPETYPAPPRGAKVRRLTRTAEHPDAALRGVSGHLRADGSGKWVAFVGKASLRGAVAPQVFAASPSSGDVRRLSGLAGGVGGDLRFSPDGRYVAVSAPDGSVHAIGARESDWGRARQVAPSGAASAHNIVISPDSALIAYNRTIDGVQQVFVTDAP